MFLITFIRIFWYRHQKASMWMRLKAIPLLFSIIFYWTMPEIDGLLVSLNYKNVHFSSIGQNCLFYVRNFIMLCIFSFKFTYLCLLHSENEKTSVVFISWYLVPFAISDMFDSCWYIILIFHWNLFLYRSWKNQIIEKSTNIFSLAMCFVLCLFGLDK